MTDLDSRRPRRDEPVAAGGDRGNAQEPERGERIAKLMARAGLCSRREAETWIEAGRVAVNGEVLKRAALNVGPADRIEVDGKPIEQPEKTRLFLFHKPPGLVTSRKDPEGRATVFGYVAEHFPDLPRLVSIGRLDINTEGLLLLTNDGGLARVLELPATGWVRRYRVRANGRTDEATLNRLRLGVHVDGVDYAPVEAVLDRAQGANVWLTLGLREGKNREIKRLLEYIGLQVNRLIRLSFGPFQLGALAEGAVEEVRTRVLRDQLGEALAGAAKAKFKDAARAERRPPPPARDGSEPLKRRHVTALRMERKADMEDAPRRRIVRSATADRRGREVAVERVVPARAPQDRASNPPKTRNSRRFSAERGEPRSESERGEARPPRRAEREGGRPFRQAEGGLRLRRFGEDRQKPPAKQGERPPRSASDAPRKPFRPRPDGVRPVRPSAGPRRFEAKRGEGRRHGDGDAPRKPFRPRPEGERPPRSSTAPRAPRSKDRTGGGTDQRRGKPPPRKGR